MNRLGYCGDNCNECPRSAATIADSKKELHQVAKLWHRLGYRERTVTADEIKCSGCTPKNACAYGIAACAGEKHIAHCGQCDEYPCAKILLCFDKTERSARELKKKCSAKEYAQLERAFFSKRKNLETGDR